MTQKQLDDKSYELKMFIADKFRDIQMQAQALKNVEDETKTLQTIIKISDFTDEVRRAYRTLNDLMSEEVEEELEEDNNYCFSSYI